MDEIRNWGSQAINDAKVIIQFLAAQLILWWNSLPQNHALAAIIAIAAVMVVDYLYRAGKLDMAAINTRVAGITGSTLWHYQKARVQGVYFPNAIFTLIVMGPILFFASVFVIGGKDPDKIGIDFVLIILLLIGRTLANLICEILPRNRFLRGLGRLVILGLSLYFSVVAIATLLLPV